MSEASQAISKLLHEAAETHHRIYQIVDGPGVDDILTVPLASKNGMGPVRSAG
jgi:hypothetical protein